MCEDYYEGYCNHLRLSVIKHCQNIYRVFKKRIINGIYWKTSDLKGKT